MKNLKSIISICLVSTAFLGACKKDKTDDKTPKQAEAEKSVETTKTFFSTNLIAHSLKLTSYISYGTDGKATEIIKDCNKDDVYSFPANITTSVSVAMFAKCNTGEQDTYTFAFPTPQQAADYEGDTKAKFSFFDVNGISANKITEGFRLSDQSTSTKLVIYSLKYNTTTSTYYKGAELTFTII